MKRNSYPAEFEALWDIFIVASKKGLIGSGGKAEAFKAYKLKECTPEDAQYLVKCLINQIGAKVRLYQAGEFVPQFKAASRWIRDERFLDVIEQPELREAVRPVSRRDQAREAIAALTGEGQDNTGRAGEASLIRLVK